MPKVKKSANKMRNTYLDSKYKNCPKKKMANEYVSRVHNATNGSILVLDSVFWGTTSALIRGGSSPKDIIVFQFDKNTYRRMRISGRSYIKKGVRLFNDDIRYFRKYIDISERISVVNLDFCDVTARPLEDVIVEMAKHNGLICFDLILTTSRRYGSMRKKIGAELGHVIRRVSENVIQKYYMTRIQRIVDCNNKTIIRYTSVGNTGHGENMSIRHILIGRNGRSPPVERKF